MLPHACRHASSRRGRPKLGHAIRCAAVIVVLLLASCGAEDNPSLDTFDSSAEPEDSFALATPTPDAAGVDGLATVDGSASDGAATPDAIVIATPEATSATPTTAGGIQLLVPEVIESYPHDNRAYTQGLEVMDGALIESTGRQAHPGTSEVFESDLRRVEIDSGQILQQADAPGDVFAEGLTRVGDELIQLTWQDNRAFWWNAETFELIREARYEGEGWGLCYDGERLVMSDGSDRLFFREPTTFEVLGSVPVTQLGQPLALINELECVDGMVWANIWRSDLIVQIDPGTGFVVAVVDASTLEQPRTAPTEVLNGIAWDTESETWLVTGKFWSTLHRVRFVPSGG
ncbi:MAG: glutaminyl-peptide cyclotransferase [Actinomycetota bacterium]